MEEKSESRTPVNLSVLTTVRNGIPYLADAVASVARQAEGVSVEHVVKDALSGDGTREWIQSRPEPHLKWLSAADKGQSDGLNQALGMSSGEIIGWLNADEFYLPGALRTVQQTFLQAPSTDVVFGDAFFVDTAGRFLRKKCQHPFNESTLRLYGCFMVSCAFFIRRAALVRVGGWDTSLKRIMDWDLYLRLAESGSLMKYVPVPLGCFRVHPGQATAPGSEVSVATREEHRRVRIKHSLPRSHIAARALHVGPGRILHGVQRAISGAYQHEWLAKKQLYALDMRWFA